MVYIHNIRSLSQLYLPIDPERKRLITIIGEAHTIIPKTHCANAITVSKFIRTILDRTERKTYVLLEFSPELDPKHRRVQDLSSFNIQDILTEAKEIGKLNLISGADIREITENLTKIYYMDPQQVNIHHFYTTYIKYLLELQPKNIHLYLDHERYSEQNLQYLHHMWNDIIGRIHHYILPTNPIWIHYMNQSDNITVSQFAQEISHDPKVYTIFTQDGNFVSYHILDILSKIADLYITSIIMRKDIPVGHFIIVIGEAHAYNMYTVFNDLLTYRENKPIDNCLKIDLSRIQI